MIRWGIIGLGRISQRFIKGLSYCDDAVLYAVASRTLDTREHFQQNYPYVKIYDDYDGLLDDPLIDVVYIALRHKDHYEWSRKALLKHKAVLCEKPATLYYHQTADLVHISQQKQIFFMEAMKSRFIPLRNDIIHLIQRDEIGAILRIETSFCNEVPYNEKNYFYERKQGGALYDVAIYNIAAILDFISSQFQNIQINQVRQHGVDVYNEIEITFQSQQTARIECAFDRNKEKKMTIIGTKGKIECTPFYRPTQATVTIGDRSYTMERDYIYDDFYTEIEAVHDALKNHQYQHSQMSHYDSLRCIQLLENIVYLSQKEGQNHG
ncbi:Gfo/Idh/MocA family protein [Candidatus Stoquefichus massiliensis]|uniref:Gfo/Idh/MocA family protein n=1 Tax=Candidatus Stoquefichus massiliensis TaxID=1470350 RepID=UPI0004816146|nr:Gfo/Idh/MocA family oxidoreductase [Candidatus Stoquefichus massiliensis]